MASDDTTDIGPEGAGEHAAPRAADERYAWYVLSVLVLVYVLNFVDRQILSILAEDIKRDLGLTDADLGFLYGTAFGVFYALFGIPLTLSLDNLVAGASLGLLGLSPWLSSLCFGAITAVMSLVGLRLGRFVARLVPTRTDLVSGIALIASAFLLPVLFA